MIHHATLCYMIPVLYKTKLCYTILDCIRRYDATREDATRYYTILTDYTVLYATARLCDTKLYFTLLYNDALLNIRK